ncbi:uroporphyrinogen decarboxylase-like [Paramacrobiotus metropolitanus]|uniref:uroporphyrinogen decarboxylase-like n=1 Tax=Paramacrobiotus metropolitanus TaxID=2943436 RepID=UPI002446251D|nr:uroporphyrinogen decarboxylase-like [Paramacrobiotus metropolitanus]
MSSFPELQNDLIIRAALGKPVDRVPVWIMRQAGRYLPEFRQLRSQYDFFTICRTPELACQVTLQPIERFNLDAAIIFSDILVIPQALGMEVQMLSEKGPHFPRPLNVPEDVKRLNADVNVNESLQYVMQALTLTRQRLNGRVPLIGFSGAPWTLMSYMIEGGGSQTQSKAKRWLYAFPEPSTQLLSLIARTVSAYLIEQVVAGAQMLQIFESHGGYLTKELFIRFALPYLQEIHDAVQAGLKDRGCYDIPLVIFAKDCHHVIGEVSALGYDVVGLDWTMDAVKTRQLVADNVTLQGNLDPCALYSPPEDLKQMARDMVDRFGKQRYIANLGHGIYPDVDPERVKCFVDAIHEYSSSNADK